MVGVVTRASITFGGCGFGILEMFGVQASSLVFPHTILNLEALIFAELLGVIDLVNLLGRDIFLFLCGST